MAGAGDGSEQSATGRGGERERKREWEWERERERAVDGGASEEQKQNNLLLNIFLNPRLKNMEFNIKTTLTPIVSAPSLHLFCAIAQNNFWRVGFIVVSLTSFFVFSTFFLNSIKKGSGINYTPHPALSHKGRGDI